MKYLGFTAGTFDLTLLLPFDLECHSCDSLQSRAGADAPSPGGEPRADIAEHHWTQRDAKQLQR